jgi:hypothetical protein
MPYSDSSDKSFRSKVTASDPTYKEKVAEPTMAAIDSMLKEWRLLVHEFDYIPIYLAWKRGWTTTQVREKASQNHGVFTI